MTIQIPTPDQLDLDPELAILAALEVTTEAAIFAVIAQHPGLRSGDELPPELETAIYWAARSIVDAGHDLLQTIRAYRGSLRFERERNADRDDFPF